MVLAKCGLEFYVELIKFAFAAAFHIVFFHNLVNLKKHRLRLGILELKFFEFPALRQYFFVVCNCLKKFRLKFWILILQKSEKNSHLNLTKFNRKNIFMKTKLKKINAWKFAVENLQTEKICCLTMKKNEKLFEKLPKIFFENEIGEISTF